MSTPGSSGSRRIFIECFETLCRRHSRWNVWSDFVYLTAAEISNSVDKVHADERNEQGRQLAARYSESGMQLFGKMFSAVVDGLEENRDQDFLGGIFMELNLGNEHNGQFFTPYSLCKCMAALSADDLRDKPWISAGDPACGAGAMLIALANHYLETGVNYQERVLFVGQDIDCTAALMCYIQLSLLGCPGYVVIGDTISKPNITCDRHGLVPVDDGRVWYTPMYFRDIWQIRRCCALLDALEQSGPER